MSYQLDTDVSADLLAEYARTVQFVQPIVADGLAISMITYGELLEGIYFGRDPGSAERDFRRWLRLVRVHPLNPRIMQRFARIRGEHRRQGTLIPDPDSIIAATALNHDLTLVTRNRCQFDRVPGLKLNP